MQAFLSERVIVLLTVLIVAGGLFATTFGSEYLLLGAVQSPVFFPRIILGLMMALLLIAIWQEVKGKKAIAPVEQWGALILLVVAAVLFANAITRVGFMLSAVPFSIVSLWIFGIRNPVIMAGYAIAVPGSIVVLFNHILKLPLPTSPFTYLF